MYSPTKNPYQFKYLQTGITGEGIKEVYLPDVPDDTKILFKSEQKFVRPEMPDHLKKDYKSWKRNIELDSGYISPFARERQEWEDQEWDRTTNGIWFWNKGVPTYITPFYYFYLSSWQTYFGHVDYRETDKEITYLLQYIEEDPDCFGLLLNTIRRYGKSSLMGCWAIYRTIRNYGHYCGMQGEKDEKIAKFYNQMIKKPFLKLPYYFTPKYDTSTSLTTEIKFEKTAKRGKRALVEEDDDDEQLESILDFRPSGEAEYDGSILHTYLNEEPGKTLTANVDERWKIVKPCLRQGRKIRGKCFMATTVEFLDSTNKGGKAYKKLFFESDFDDKQSDGRTKSGLYAAFLPGYAAYEGFYDEYGHPLIEEAKQSLLQERESYRDNPRDYSAFIRKYPLYIKEIFYVSSDKCVFNATILQDRLAEINMSREPMTSKVEFYWENNVRFSKVKWRHNPVNGWCQAAWLPDNPEETNLVGTKVVADKRKYYPKNESKFALGNDPVDHRVTVEGKSNGDDEVSTTRRSRPVLFAKRKYDSAIDGPLTQDILEQRAREKYPYKTNRYVLMMDVRTSDPNVFYERALMICWFLGASVQVETQKPGLQNWFYEAGCEDFLQQEYVPESSNKARNPYSQGTAASTTSIHEYTEAKATYIEYFGHTIPFRELIEDDLVFKPHKTTEHDYSVAGGWTELACKIQPRQKEKRHIDLLTMLPMFDGQGNPLN